MRRVYLDHNATTPQASEVTDAMRPFFEDKFGNPSSTHREGQEVRNAMEAARERVARFLGARAEDWKAVCPDFPPFRHTSPVVSTSPWISPA